MSAWPAPPDGWPSWLWTVPYVGAYHPAAPELPPIVAGANCQRYAYAILALFGLDLPGWRSSELWADDTRTEPVAGRFEPLDLLLFNATNQPWGAHIAVFVAADRILHLCREVGTPAVWTFAEFAERRRYATLFGAKRVSRCS